MGNSKPLSGKVALVAGATRGAGRGIARMLGEAGATVYCSGRSVRGQASPSQRPETIEETAELVTKAGGTGIYTQTDHTDESQVISLFDRIISDHHHIDVIVNDIWGGDSLTEWGKSFWELDSTRGFALMNLAVNSHIITSRHGAPHMVKRGSGLIIEITDGDFMGYRGNLFYDLAKATVIRLAYAMNVELQGTGVTAMAVTPGFLRSEAVLEHFAVSEENWQDAIAKDQYFAESETPCFVGRGIAALAADQSAGNIRGKVWSASGLAHKYGFTDIDGRVPNFANCFDREIEKLLSSEAPLEEPQRALVLGRYRHLHLDDLRKDYTDRMAAVLGLNG